MKPSRWKPDRALAQLMCRDVVHGKKSGAMEPSSGLMANQRLAFDCQAEKRAR